ncbi:MAG TPA: hypothetical protein VGB63_03310 [Pedobacter sp.]|jgi:hypothetical protein
MPKRIVFEGSKRFQELNLANIGQDSAQYSISIVNYRMKENGEFEEIHSPEPGLNFAGDYVRIFPRTVFLAPNEAQTVKVQLTKTASLAPGEYRSHIYFRSVPQQVPPDGSTTSDSSNISIKLTPIFGLSIPVIIRAGEQSLSVTLSDCVVEKKNGIATLKVTLNRTGNISAYGHLIASHISPEGTVSQVGIARGLGIYTPNAKRHFQLTLDQTPGINFSSGRLAINYVAPEENKSEIITKTELVLR